MTLTDLNTKLRTQSYIDGGAAPTQADAKEFEALFGNNPRVIAWVARMASYYAAERQELAAVKDKSQKQKPKQPAKAEKKGKSEPKDKKPAKDAAAAAPAPAVGGVSEKKMRAVVKEGGKKAQDLAGMADMGSNFGLANLTEPEGDMALLEAALEAMNKPVDPESEERKGGAQNVAKILVSATDAKFACIVHVPELFTDPSHAENVHKYNVSAIDWFTAAFSTLPGDQQGHTVLEQSKTLVKATYTPDPEKGRYTLKAKDAVIGSSFAFLRSRNLVVDDDDSDDEMVFGDDDMPGY